MYVKKYQNGTEFRSPFSGSFCMPDGKKGFHLKHTLCSFSVRFELNISNCFLCGVCCEGVPCFGWKHDELIQPTKRHNLYAGIGLSPSPPQTPPFSTKNTRRLMLMMVLRVQNGRAGERFVTACVWCVAFMCFIRVSWLLQQHHHQLVECYSTANTSRTDWTGWADIKYVVRWAFAQKLSSFDGSDCRAFALVGRSNAHKHVSSSSPSNFVRQRYGKPSVLSAWYMGSSMVCTVLCIIEVWRCVGIQLGSTTTGYDYRTEPDDVQTNTTHTHAAQPQTHMPHSHIHTTRGGDGTGHRNIKCARSPLTLSSLSFGFWRCFGSHVWVAVLSDVGSLFTCLSICRKVVISSIMFYVHAQHHTTNIKYSIEGTQKITPRPTRRADCAQIMAILPPVQKPRLRFVWPNAIVPFVTHGFCDANNYKLK